jgi:outer membrane protein TolC
VSLLAGTLSAGRLPAQESPELDRLVREALERNPDVAAALARWRAAAERPEQVGSLPDPEFTAQVIRFRDRGIGIRSDGETWYMLRQSVPFPGKLGLRSRIARREAELAGEEFEAARLTLAEAVRLAAYRLLHAEVLEEITLVNQQLVERTLGIARARYEVGAAAQHELLLSRVEYARVANDLAELRRMRRDAVAELEALLGRRLEPDFTVPIRHESAIQTPLDADSLVALALVQRPEMRTAAITAARDTVALRLARKAYLPDLMVGLEYWVGEGENPSPLPDERYVFDVGLTIPWIWKGKHDAAVRQARADLVAGRRAFEGAANRVRREVEAAVAEVEAAAERTRNFQQSILPEAELNLESATEAYRTDRAGFLTVLDTQRSLNELRIAYHTTLVELLMAGARLDRAVGTPPPGPSAGGDREPPRPDGMDGDHQRQAEPGLTARGAAR